MNEPHLHQPTSSQDTPALPELHCLYLLFLDELGEGRHRDAPRLGYAQFTEWWRGLDPATRKMCESDFRKGYPALIEEGRRAVSELIARYEEPN